MQPDMTDDGASFDGLAAAIRAPIDRLANDRSPRANAGLAVYRNNVRSAFHRALAETFPVVRDLVGAEFFQFAALAYFDRHPARSQLVARYGDQFPVFLEMFEPARSVPYLADVARIEIAWLQSYHAPDANVLGPARFALLARERCEGLRLVFHPSVRWVSSDFPAHTIWTHCRRKEAAALNAPEQAETTLFARPRHQVESRTVSDVTLRLLRVLISGETIGQAFAQAASVASADHAARALTEIVAAGVVTSYIQVEETQT